MESQGKAPRKRTRTRKVEVIPSEKVELTVEEPLDIPENKYQPKPKVGANKRPNIVNSVGLGNLKVETVKGLIDG